MLESIYIVKMKKLAFVIVFFCTVMVANGQSGMNIDKMHKVISTVSDTFSREGGAWEFIIGETFMMCITDISNNRMRIISPIKKYEDMKAFELEDALEANFHSALDVRYAMSDDIMWAAFIHPFSELTESQLADAISQVYSAAVTFGDTYTSTHLTFPKSKEAKERKKF